MSAQGGTLARRGTVHLPVWPIAAALAAAVAVMIVLSIPTSGTKSVQVTRVGDLSRFANSGAAVREQGGGLPLTRPFDTGGLESASLWTAGQAQAYIDGLAARAAMFENSSAAIREQGSFAYHGAGRAHEVIVGITPSTTTSFATGLENPGAYLTDDTFTPTGGPHAPIMVNGRPCPQCR